MTRSVTKTSGSIVREGLYCQSCGKPAPSGATRRWKFCNDTCRQAAHRRGKKSFKKPPTPTSRVKQPSDYEHDLMLITLASWETGIIEVWNPKHGRGVLDLFRHLNDGNFQMGARCLFHGQRWRFIPWSQVWLLAYHRSLPDHLRWIHPKHKASRIGSKRLCQLFDSDRNNDLSFDAEKWNDPRTGGTAVETDLEVFTENAQALRNGLVDIDNQKLLEAIHGKATDKLED
jgi:hypothetical protein